jgi:hypothetical protein
MQTRLLLFLLLVFGGLYVLFSDFLDPATSPHELEQVQASIPDVRASNAPAELPLVNEPQNVERSAFEPSPSDSYAQTSTQEETFALQVQVVSPQGDKLAGVPVSLWTVFEGRYSSLPWKESVTNESGLATLHLPPPPADYDRSLAVGFPFPCGKSKPVRLMRSELPAEPITLTLAATGEVEVQLLGADGKPWLLPMTVILAPSPGLFQDKRSVLRKDGPSYAIAKTNNQGLVHFPHVALNRALVAGLASVVGNDQWGQWSTEGFAGPRTAGGLTKIQLRLTKPADVVRFRLLDPDGEPVRERAWSAIITEYTVLDSSFRTQGRQRKQTTDELGYTLCGLPQLRADEPWTYRGFILTCQLIDGGRKLQAEVDLTEDFGPGVHDLGDVQLQSFSLLAGGQLVSGAGAELHHLSVRVESVAFAPNGASGYQQWEPVIHEAVFEPDGGFQIEGVTSAKRVRLTFQAEGYHGLVKIVDVGSSNLDFALEASLLVTGRLELPEGFDLSRAKVYFIPPGSSATGSSRAGRVSVAKLQQDGSFAFSGLQDAAGGEVAVFWGRSNTALARIADVVPVAAHVIPDPRINPLRVGSIHHYEVSFVDEDGESVRNIRYRIFKDVDSPESTQSEDLQDGTGFTNHFTLNTQQQKVKVGYWQAGFAYSEQIIAPGDTQLVLQPPVFATLKLENNLDLPVGVDLEAQLISDAAGGLASMRETVPAAIPFLLPKIPLPTAGIYQVKLFLKDKETRKSVPVSWEDGSLTKEFVVSEDSGQVFRVSFPNDNIQLAAEQLQNQ